MTACYKNTLYFISAPRFMELSSDLYTFGLKNQGPFIKFEYLWDWSCFKIIFLEVQKYGYTVEQFVWLLFLPTSVFLFNLFI